MRTKETENWLCAGKPFTKKYIHATFPFPTPFPPLCGETTRFGSYREYSHCRNSYRENSISKNCIGTFCGNQNRSIWERRIRNHRGHYFSICTMFLGNLSTAQERKARQGSSSSSKVRDWLFDLFIFCFFILKMVLTNWLFHLLFDPIRMIPVLAAYRRIRCFISWPQSRWDKRCIVEAKEKRRITHLVLEGTISEKDWSG